MIRTLTIAAMLLSIASTVALVAPAPATESMLPPGFLGDWCVTKSDERNTPPPWSYIAYRAPTIKNSVERSLAAGANRSQSTVAPDMWWGHLAVAIENDWLLDPTLDQQEGMAAIDARRAARNPTLGKILG